MLTEIQQFSVAHVLMFVGTFFPKKNKTNLSQQMMRWKSKKA